MKIKVGKKRESKNKKIQKGDSRIVKELRFEKRFMSIEKINLRKFLQLVYADSRLQRSLLLADIRDDRSKEAGEKSSNGGDFYGPFWADVKDHAAGRSDLTEQTEIRIKKNKGRARLYPILSKCFLDMWNEKMRWRNEAFEFVPESVKAQLELKKLGTIKVENTAAVKIWDGTHRVIYPYFSEAPTLPEEAARLGFWALEKALPNYEPKDFRIVDIQRRAYFRPVDVGVNGNEEKLFTDKYAALLKAWQKLRDER